MNEADFIIQKLGLQKHPEGGAFRETYRHPLTIQQQKNGERNLSTAIYFLLRERETSDWHRVKSDEMWHFYAGSCLVLEQIDGNGKFSRLYLGNHFHVEERQEFPQHLIPAHAWQRAYSAGAYSLAGCTVTPGFSFEDFEMAKPETLAEQYPKLASEITSNPF